MDVAVSNVYTVDLILFILWTCPGFPRRNLINHIADMYLFGTSCDSYKKFGNIGILKAVGSHGEIWRLCACVLPSHSLKGRGSPWDSSDSCVETWLSVWHDKWSQLDLFWQLCVQNSGNRNTWVFAKSYSPFQLIGKQEMILKNNCIIQYISITKFLTQVLTISAVS